MKRSKRVTAPIRPSTFAVRRRRGLEYEVERMLAAGALDEANADVFDALIESWRSREAAEIEAAAGSQVTTWSCEHEQLSAQIELIDEESGADDAVLAELRSELRAAQQHLRGAL